MPYSSGSQRMVDYWANYVKPSPAEAKRRKREREHNWKRVPWIMYFSKARACEGKHRTLCKKPAHWVYVEQDGRMRAKGTLRILCTDHVSVVSSSMGESEACEAWVNMYGWEVLNEDGTVRLSEGRRSEDL